MHFKTRIFKSNPESGDVSTNSIEVSQNPHRKSEGNYILSSTMINSNATMPPEQFNLSPVTMKENLKLEDDQNDVVYVEANKTVKIRKPEVVKSDPVPMATDERRHLCVECDKTFSTSSSLKRHVNRVHLRKGEAFLQ